jgi:methylmalonyl-CoA mutase cobalamin-binding subunit
MNDNGGKVIVLGMATRLDIPAERILKAAIERSLESVVISGYDKDGNEYFASSLADGADALWILERCKKKLLEIGDGE